MRRELSGRGQRRPGHGPLFPQGPGTPWAFWFFVLCTIADALLEISFVPGMLVFGAGHVCLIVWLWGLATPSWWSLALWVAVYILTALLFRKELPTLGKLTAPFLLYPALLGGSLALGLPLVFLLGWEWWPVALGTLLFYISDMLVAKNQLAHWMTHGRSPSWPCTGRRCTSSAWGCGRCSRPCGRNNPRRQGREGKDKTRRSFYGDSSAHRGGGLRGRPPGSELLFQAAGLAHQPWRTTAGCCCGTPTAARGFPLRQRRTTSALSGPRSPASP